MVADKKLRSSDKEEELLLQDFSRRVSAKSSALFYGNAFIVSGKNDQQYIQYKSGFCFKHAVFQETKLLEIAVIGQLVQIIFHFCDFFSWSFTRNQ